MRITIFRAQTRSVRGALGRVVASVALLAVGSGPAFGQSVFASGSTGADGPLTFYTPPPATQGPATAYDSDRHVVVMFSSHDSLTREWDGVRWNTVTTAAAPSPRDYALLAYDSARHVTVMFGTQTTNDTWEYDGTNWIQRTPLTKPPQSFGAMAYHAGRGRVVFVADSGGGTWEWDGTTWTKQNISGPPSYGYQAMAYDSDRNVAVLYDSYYYRQTWEYGQDGMWMNRTPPNLSPTQSSAGFSMTYDSVRKVTVLSASTGNTQETWLWDGGAWTQAMPAASPPPRSNPRLAFDVFRSRAVFFGGSSTSDTWLWDGTVWTAPVQAQPFPLIDMASKPNGTWNYTTVTIPAGVEIRFKPNANNTPVVWLASGDVAIDGVINLDGSNAVGPVQRGNEAPGGPGGYAGGLGGLRFDTTGSYSGTPGSGPGGGLPGTTNFASGGHAGYGMPGNGARAGAAYGNRLIQPLLGGSGGGGSGSTDSGDGYNGGGGGGALLIASSGAIRVDGAIHANGGTGNYIGGYGSGGSIRLAANSVSGNGTLNADSGGGGQGRIRVEGFLTSGRFTNSYITAPPLAVGETIPSGTIRITSIDGKAVPSPPGGDTSAPDVVFSKSGNVTIALATTNLPQGTKVRVRVNAAGQVITADSTPTNAAGNATATVNVPSGVGTVEASAEYIPPH